MSQIDNYIDAKTYLEELDKVLDKLHASNGFFEINYNSGFGCLTVKPLYLENSNTYMLMDNKTIGFLGKAILKHAEFLLTEAKNLAEENVKYCRKLALEETQKNMELLKEN